MHSQSICNPPKDIAVISTSYPSTHEDWQATFIRNIVASLSSRQNISPHLWAPPGQIPDECEHLSCGNDAQFLSSLREQGGIAHLLRNKKLQALITSASLLYRLRRIYQTKKEIDVFHINWLQNSLPLIGLNKKAVITVLGSDFKLLAVPGMTSALRTVLKTNKCIIAPNAEWMRNDLERLFGDLCPISPLPFGIDDCWYQIQRKKVFSAPQKWFVVSRLTENKLGRLFSWGAEIFDGQHHELHLIGPNQEDVNIPSWVHYHGPASSTQLAQQFFPEASGLITLSQHCEGRPQVMLEALAAGIPIIASAIEAHSDFIEDGANGYLVTSKKEFLRKLEHLSIRKNNDAISVNARSYAKRENGTWDECAERFEKLYQQLEV